MPSKPKNEEELGSKFGKKDVERIGLFSEMPYMNGKGYVSPFPKMNYDKGRNLLAEGPKTKTGKQDYLFDKDFKRLFVGEAIKGRGKKPEPPRFKNVSTRPFMPPGDTKLHASPGDWYGTFQGRMDAFSGKPRPRPPYKKEERNILSSPGKKGGYGYNNICINPYPTHSVSKYDLKPKYKDYGTRLNGPLRLGMYPQAYFERNPFKEPDKFKPGPTYVPPNEKEWPILPPGKFIPTGPGKPKGGCQAGCFDKFPEQSKPDKYVSISDQWKPKKHEGGNFFPQSTAEKTFYTFSVINENLRFRCNAVSQKTYQPTFVKHLM